MDISYESLIELDEAGRHSRRWNISFTIGLITWHHQGLVRSDGVAVSHFPDRNKNPKLKYLTHTRVIWRVNTFLARDYRWLFCVTGTTAASSQTTKQFLKLPPIPFIITVHPVETLVSGFYIEGYYILHQTVFRQLDTVIQCPLPYFVPLLQSWRIPYQNGRGCLNGPPRQWSKCHRKEGHVCRTWRNVFKHDRQMYVVYKPMSIDTQYNIYNPYRTNTRSIITFTQPDRHSKQFAIFIYVYLKIISTLLLNWSNTYV